MWSGTQENWGHTSETQNGQCSGVIAEDKEEEARFLERVDWKSYNGADVFTEAMIGSRRK